MDLEHVAINSIMVDRTHSLTHGLLANSHSLTHSLTLYSLILMHRLVGRKGDETPLYYEDYAQLEAETSMKLLDSVGLFCVKHPSKMENYWSEDEITTTYYEELKELTLSITKADCAAVAAHALRLQGDQQGERLSVTKPLARCLKLLHIHFVPTRSLTHSSGMQLSLFITIFLMN